MLRGKGRIDKCGGLCGSFLHGRAFEHLVGRAAWQGPGGVALLEAEVTKLTRGGL